MRECRLCSAPTIPHSSDVPWQESTSYWHANSASPALNWIPWPETRSSTRSLGESLHHYFQLGDLLRKVFDRLALRIGQLAVRQWIGIRAAYDAARHAHDGRVVGDRPHHHRP